MAAPTVKLVALFPVPQLLVTLISPVVAPAGTVAVIWVAFTTVNEALVPLNFTALTPTKFVPLIVTVVPDVPLVGVKELIVGRPPLTVMVTGLDTTVGLVTQAALLVSVQEVISPLERVEVV